MHRTRTTFPAVSVLVFVALSSGCASTSAPGPGPGPGHGPTSTSTCDATAAKWRAVEETVQPTKDGEDPIPLRHVVIDAAPDPKTLAAVQRLASVEALTGRTLDAWKADAKDFSIDEGGFTGLHVDVTFNGCNLLQLNSRVDTVAAYPSSEGNDVLIDLRTGRAIGADDVFAADKKAALAAKLQPQLARAIEAIGKETDVADIVGDIADARITPGDLANFQVRDTGLAFVYAFDFPHVIQALEPDPFFLTWAELGPFLAKDGPIGPGGPR